MNDFKIGNQVKILATGVIGRITAIEGDKFILVSAAEGNPTVGPFSADQLEHNHEFLLDFSPMDNPDVGLG